jgi:raffinose/stachyose/melibiose transport system permease protein
MVSGTQGDVERIGHERLTDYSAASIAARQRRRKMSRTLKGWAFLLPTFVFIGAFAYWPAIRALEGAFTSWDGVSPPTWVGLGNFQQLWHDTVFLGSFLHLLIWSVIGIPLGMGASFVVALLIYRLASNRAQYWFRLAFALTLCLPGIVGILTWSNFYEIDGLINTILNGIGLHSIATAWLSNPKTALGALIFMGFPWVQAFAMLVFYAGLQQIPRDILDAAAVDGIGSFRRVWHIEIPLIKGQLKVILVLSIIGITQNLLPPLLLTQGGPGNATWTPVLYMYEQAFQYDTIGYALAIAFVLFVVSLVLAILTMRFLRTDADTRRRVA